MAPALPRARDWAVSELFSDEPPGRGKRAAPGGAKKCVLVMSLNPLARAAADRR